MRTLILVLVCLSLFFTFQMCNTDLTETDYTHKSLLRTDSLLDDEEWCPPCCNSGRPTDCVLFPQRSLKLGNPVHEICITCGCCIKIWDYYDGNLPPAEQIPENITLRAACDDIELKQGD